MRYNYGRFRRLLDGFCREMEEMSRQQPSRYLAVLALSSQDSEYDMEQITENKRYAHAKIVSEYQKRVKNN